MKIILRNIYILLCLLFAYVSQAQKLSSQQMQQWATTQSVKSFGEYREFISLPCDAHFPKDMLKNVAWLKNAFSKRNFKVDILSSAGSPIVLASRISPKAKHTVLFYMHFDGQPVDKRKWFQEDPFKPVLKKKDAQGKWSKVPWNSLTQKPLNQELRFFARAASDDKGPIMMLLTAVDVLDQQKIDPAINIKVVLDSEEEIGSPNLAPVVKKYQKLLKADRMIIMDGPRHMSGKPTLMYGCRGNSRVNIKVFGARVPQHSGHYGNYAPNPAMRLSQLLASMKDHEGRVTIKGFYDGITLDQPIQKLLAAVPDNKSLIHQKLGIAQAEKVGKNLQEALQYPSLNIHGLKSAWVGKNSRTIVPSEAEASIDIRLVPESDPKRLIKLVRQHIQKQGYHIVSAPPTDAERLKYPKIAMVRSRISSAPFRTPVDGAMGQWLRKAMNNTFTQAPVQIRIMGGTVPIARFINILKIPAVVVPLVNPDNNQHSPNENLRVGNYVDGVRTCLGILTTKF